MTSASLLNANAAKIPLAPESMDMCVTSPPYYGLRDYGVDGQLGLEPTPEQYIKSMVAVGREIWRVLKPHGTLWLNIGDSYATHAKGRGSDASSTINGPGNSQTSAHRIGNKQSAAKIGLKDKDLIGIPWMLAFALRADGWYLRSDIIWSKPNPMPESVRDRPTKAHEYLFLLSKSRQYYYDADAIREGDDVYVRKGTGTALGETKGLEGQQGRRDRDNFLRTIVTQGRNCRTVWEIATRPYAGAHFATFPPDLVEPCIKAGSSERGVCPECGKPWERVVEKAKIPHSGNTESQYAEGTTANRLALLRQAARESGGEYVNARQTVGWQPTCEHDHDPVPATVLDPFAGSGTSLVVARALGRNSVGLDLSLPYLRDQAQERLELKGNWWQGAREAEANLDGLPMFQS